jgi:redox-sensitive bicupin YhaK (pirin superfamily)
MLSINRIISSDKINMGGGLITRQPLPAGEIQQLDPFLLLHHTGPITYPPFNDGLPFAPHPHKGFETVTIIFEGAVEHKDSLGLESIIETGGVQWMTAGKGIVHSENLPKDFRNSGGTVEYIQLWINLPAKYKQVPAKYQGIQAGSIPEIELEEGAGKLRLISGKMYGSNGPVESITNVDMMTYSLIEGKNFSLEIPEQKETLFYLLDGQLKWNDKHINAHDLVQWKEYGKANFSVSKTAKLLVAYADRINEPVVAHGPFVMNTQTEIMEAMRDYQMGKMGVLIL